MMRQLLNRFPRLKRAARSLRRLLWDGAVSSHYRPVAESDVAGESERLKNSWQNDALPQRQRELVDREIEKFRAGKPVAVFDVAVEAMSLVSGPGKAMSVLEIGCSSGFYSEVFEIAGLPLSYSGCDYAPRFIDLARARYPNVDFQVGDSTALQYGDGSFDIVISGCCLLHIPDYLRAIDETVRVASSYVLFHRTPVIPGVENRVFTKQAYGVETVEIHFGEDALLDAFTRSGLSMIKIWPLSQGPSGEAQRSYLCAKVRSD